jgi:hypothetical protein
MFYSSFPLKRVNINNKHKNWITLGILTSCKRKRELYIACKNNNNPDRLKHYKSYCKICLLSSKKQKSYADKIKNTSNKNKTIWNILNLESNKTGNTETTNTLNINGSPTSDFQKTANEFNKYFLTIAKSVNTKQNKLSPYSVDNTTSPSLLNTFSPAPFSKL